MYKLNNFWEFIKNSIQTIPGNWNFTGTLKIGTKNILTEITNNSNQITTINSEIAALPTPNYLGVFTTTAKNALIPTLGNTCFDSTLAKLCVYTGAAWETITSV